MGNYVNFFIINNVINVKYKVEKNNIFYNELMSVIDKFDKVKLE